MGTPLPPPIDTLPPPPPPPEAVVEVRATEAVGRADARVVQRVFILSGTIAIVAIAAIFVWTNIVGGINPGFGAALVIVGFVELCLAYLVLSVAIAMRRAWAVVARLDGRGLQLQFEGGRVETRGWWDKRSAFSVTALDPAHHYAGPPAIAEFVGTQWFGLTTEASAQLLEFARNRGFRVDTRKRNLKALGRGVTYDVKPAVSEHALRL
jgi:hypothetical protein